MEVASLPEAERFASSSLDDGYLAVGSRRGLSEGATALWFSPDGRTWAEAALATSITPCYGGELEPSARIADAWAGSRGLVALGWEQVGSDRVCPVERVVAWTSTDAQTWTKQTDFGPGDLNGSPIAVWETAEGWEAAIRDEAQFLSIWSSADGSGWRPITTIGQAGREQFGSIGISQDGRLRVAAIRTGEAARERLVGSADGRSWSDVVLPQLDMGDDGWSSMVAILGPTDSMPAWVVVERVDDSGAETIVWVSADLVSWQRASFPAPMIGSVRRTSAGILAVSFDPCVDAGECDLEPRAFLSRDGLSWAPVFEGTVPQSWAEGPAGLIGLRDGVVYALRPTAGLSGE